MRDEYDVGIPNDVVDHEQRGIGVNALASLIAKAKALVDMLDDAERNHGALIGSKTLTAANELRIELSRWK